MACAANVEVTHEACCADVHSHICWAQVKRIHEYKRQLLNVMSIIHRYSEIKAMSPEEREQVTCIQDRFALNCALQEHFLASWSCRRQEGWHAVVYQQ